MLRFLPENKAWWITPIILVLIAAALLILQAGVGNPPSPEEAPFTYDLY